MLNQMANEVINDTERQVVDAIGDFKSLTRQSDEVLMRFVTNLNNNFDELLDKESRTSPSSTLKPCRWSRKKNWMSWWRWKAL